MTGLPASEVRANFADMLNRVAYGEERVIISRHAKPIAALVPIADVERLAELEKRAARDVAPEPSATPEHIPPEIMERIRAELYERARHEIYTQVHTEAQKRLEALVAPKKKPR